ncbi:hypothetical protein CY34DRAFT_806489 [Suillus luteus UH-Slu-Lm8-n1]|uniref:Uncharacterized protein n=1 Tax=Suillus luteus UH-Slu-Lm8-n1 TaxID=930992 RepID=A0A0D0AGZ5_9AGAM|nr:hypothetical protein CY34DRAFT_806489 [Suillus luteus UH-Slu-Lm8-n1]
MKTQYVHKLILGIARWTYCLIDLSRFRVGPGGGRVYLLYSRRKRKSGIKVTETTIERVKGRDVDDTFLLFAKVWRHGSRHGAEKIRVVEEAPLDWCAKDWLALQPGKWRALDEPERERQVRPN